MKSKNNGQLRYWRVPHLDNLELLHASSITYEYPRHMHEEYSVGIILRGVEVHTSRGISHHAPPGNLLIINADEPHSSKSVRAEYRVIKIRPKVLNQILAEGFTHNLESPHFPRPVVHDKLVFRSLLNLHLKLEQNVSSLEHESEFVSTIGLLLRRQLPARQDKSAPMLQPIGREPRYVKLVRDYLKTHYAENVSLAQLTAITNLSPFYLLRVFGNQVGCPPHEYQTQVRIAHARKLIRKGNPISAVALDTGFFDQSHFSRNFKRIVGVPPGQYYSQNKIVQDTPE
jgi:AraC-like DNA-binding protein